MDPRFESRLPCAKNAFDIFEGQWLSKVPGFGFGSADLFNDPRINFFEQSISGFAGKSVIELGPLEGGHTYRISQLGASSILSIEANKDAFLRCLIVKDALQFDAKFICGDFMQMFRGYPPRVDVIVASGVLYHMEEPIELMEKMTECADQICLWTHYYDPDIAAESELNRLKFSCGVEYREFRGRRIGLATHSYLDDAAWKGFAGGIRPISRWIEREGILSIFDALGFEVIVDLAGEHIGHSMSLVANRRRLQR